MGKSYLFAGELAKLTGVSTDTLRYYERQNVLEKPPRSTKGYRLYPKNALAQVKLIRAALAIGFGIKELASIFQRRRSGIAPCREVRQLAADKLSEVETRLKELSVFRDKLQLVLRDWDKDLSEMVDGENAKLLEKLAAAENDFNQENLSSLKFKL